MSRKRYTPTEEQFIFDNMNRLSFEEIARQLGRDSANSIHLFLHRRRKDPRTVVKNNLLIEMLTRKFGKPEYFSPTRQFFDNTHIGQKHYWDLYKGIKVITDKECERIANELKIHSLDIFEARQMDLF